VTRIGGGNTGQTADSKRGALAQHPFLIGTHPGEPGSCGTVSAAMKNGVVHQGRRANRGRAFSRRPALESSEGICSQGSRAGRRRWSPEERAEGPGGGAWLLNLRESVGNAFTVTTSTEGKVVLESREREKNVVSMGGCRKGENLSCSVHGEKRREKRQGRDGELKYEPRGGGLEGSSGCKNFSTRLVRLGRGVTRQEGRS